MPEDVAAVFSDYERMLESGITASETFFSNVDFINELPNEYIDNRSDDDCVILLNRKFYRHQVIHSMVSVTAMIKRPVYDELKWYDESLRCCQDWEFLTRMCRQYRIACLDEPLAVVRFCVEGNSNRIASLS